MSSERDRQILRAREIDKMSTVMITLGVNVVKKNPIKVGAYVFGLLLCLFFNGMKVSDSQRSAYQQQIDNYDYSALQDAEIKYFGAKRHYESSRGFFYSCDSICLKYKGRMEEAKAVYTVLQIQEQQSTSTAKSKLGLFSEVGVGETRDLFWQRFAQGKGFAARQTKWDALFLGISAMGRDEGLVSYLFRLVMSMLFNFTIGLIGAVITFIFSLVGVIRSYQASILLGFTFFALASLAAVAFVLSWLIGLYFATAGVVYVSAVVMSNNLRLGGGEEHGRRRVN